MHMLDFFDGYVSKGLKPIAVYRNSKIPVGDQWNLNWSGDRWRGYFHDNKYNMGILLGEIVDVEGDTPEACDRLERMIDGAARPMYRSKKSVHNLFLNPDPDLTCRTFDGIEFRGNSHQSVVPPSFHEEGSKYKFLEGTKWPIPPMPEALLEYYFRKKSENNVKKKIRGPQPTKRLNPGFTRTTCCVCNYKFYIHKKRLMLEVKAFKEHNLPWMCHGCREFDLRHTCRRIRIDLNRLDVYIETNASILEDIPIYQLKK